VHIFLFIEAVRLTWFQGHIAGNTCTKQPLYRTQQQLLSF